MTGNPFVDGAAAVVGTVVLAATVLDFVWTTLASSAGGGPITARVAPILRRPFARIQRNDPTRPLLRASGVGVLVGLLSLWILATLLGWWLITWMSAAPFVASQDQAPASAIERLYFVGYSVFTLGIGDFTPNGGFWQMLAVAMAGSGLVIVTLSITYVMPIVSAAADQRRLAAWIRSLGDDPGEVLERSWTGSDFGMLPTHLANMTPVVNSSAQSHLAYPILHYFHPTERSTAIAPNVASLYLAIEMLEKAVAPQVRPPVSATRPCRLAIELLLDTLRGAHIAPADRPLELPPLEHLTRSEIPVVSAEEHFHAAESSTRSRQLLKGWLVDSGWSATESGSR